jgi:hypothetical protein
VIDWQQITRTEIDWEDFLFTVGSQTVLHAARLVTKEGLGIAEAVNQSIDWVTRGLEETGAPTELVDAIHEQYLEDRSIQMFIVAEAIRLRRDLDEEAQNAPRRKRKRHRVRVEPTKFAKVGFS